MVPGAQAPDGEQLGGAPSPSDALYSWPWELLLCFPGNEKERGDIVWAAGKLAFPRGLGAGKEPQAAPAATLLL